MIITNAFSLQMLDGDQTVQIRNISLSAARYFADRGLVSAIGHPDTAAVVSGQLGVDLPVNRVNVALTEGNSIIVAQLTGGRLPEGATTLPAGFEIVYKMVSIHQPEPIKVPLPLDHKIGDQWLDVYPDHAEHWTEAVGSRDYTPRKQTTLPLGDMRDFLYPEKKVEVVPVEKQLRTHLNILPGKISGMTINPDTGDVTNPEGTYIFTVSIGDTFADIQAEIEAWFEYC